MFLDVGQAGCAWAAPHSTVTGNTGRCWSGWAPRAGTHETSMGTSQQISLQTDSSLSLLSPSSALPGHRMVLSVIIWPGLLCCIMWSPGLMSSSCAEHENLSFILQILFIKSPWACHNRTVEKWYHHEVDENTGLRSLTDITEHNTHFPCPGSGQIGAFSVNFSLIATFSRITRLFVRLVPMLSGTKESVSSPEKYYWENIQRERDRKNIWMTKNINVPLLATRAGWSVISST